MLSLRVPAQCYAWGRPAETSEVREFGSADALGRLDRSLLGAHALCALVPRAKRPMWWRERPLPRPCSTSLIHALPCALCLARAQGATEHTLETN